MSALSDARADAPFGVYLHVPLCLSKCPYCDFVSREIDSCGADPLARVVEALRGELELALTDHPQLRGRPLDSIYFGGGTPSLLAPTAIGALVDDLCEAFTPRGAPEVTLECNPMAAESRRLGAFREAGVNRVSLGVQSFQEENLRALGRLHSAQDARSAIDRVEAVGFDSWGLDLIFGVPGSTLESWRRDLREAVRLAPPHVSVYGLTLHEGTPLFECHARGEATLPDEETQRAMFFEARDTLGRGGWRHYEISNYARPGHEGRHNSLYWTGGEYLGLGAGAHSFFGRRRWANPGIGGEAPFSPAVSAGEGHWRAVAEDAPSERARRGETVMLALRLCEGVTLAELDERLGCDFREEYGEVIDRLTAAGLLSVTAERVRLTDEGLVLSDGVFVAFF